MKKALRKSFLEKRQTLTLEEAARKSQVIFQNWLALFDSQKHQTVHTFLSMSSFKEVDTSIFISHLEQHHPGVRIGVPRVGFESKELTHHEFLPHDLERNSWGILEPKTSAPRLPPEAFDMVLVPMLAFDRRGYRIGYGGGYYDRFLAQVRSDCLKVGLAFQLSLSKSSLPTGPHDVALSCVVTEAEVHLFGGNAG